MSRFNQYGRWMPQQHLARCQRRWRLHADPRFTGQGITLAVLDSGFYSHPDLTQPHNRIIFVLHDHAVRRMQALGSWNDWQPPGMEMEQVEAGVWQGPLLPDKSYSYKFY